MDLHVLEFVQQPLPDSLGGQMVALVGDDPFLTKIALDHLQAGVDEDNALHAVPGRQAEWRDVADELFTVSLFGSGGRMVLLQEADDFVSAHRQQLEAYVANPSAAGTLLLDVKSWPRNTRLAKAILKSGITVDCRAPQRKAGNRTVSDRARIVDWIRGHGRAVHQVQLDRVAAEQLLDLSGEHFGMLDQELAKLGLYADGHHEVTAEDVVSIVGGWRTQSTWDLLDAVCNGDAKSALVQLDHLLMAGEHPQALFGAFSWSLRRFAIATRHIERQQRDGRRVDLPAALVAAGFSKYPTQLQLAERQLRQVGRVRAGQLLHWLLEADAQMKSSHSSPDRARYVLERLMFQLCRQTAEPVTSHC